MFRQIVHENGESQSLKALSGKMFLLVAGFFGAFLLAHYVVILIRRRIEFYCPPYWPISIFWPRLPEWRYVAFALLIMAFFSLSVIYLSKIRYNFWLGLALGVALILGTNLLQGWRYGFQMPIAGGVRVGEFSIITMP